MKISLIVYIISRTSKKGKTKLKIAWVLDFSESFCLKNLKGTF